MCGICGVVSADSRTDLGGLVDCMCAAMVHRGPDAAGELVDPGVALGMRRLSIIDRATGLQPQFNEARSIAVICNGEIYNFRELREELEQKGYRFRTRSDTEAIVHAYEAWGDQALERSRGIGLASSRCTTRGSMARCCSPPRCARCWRVAWSRAASRRPGSKAICCS